MDSVHPPYSPWHSSSRRFLSLEIGAKVVPVDKASLCEDQESYITRKPRDAYWRVLVRGCCADDAGDSKSIVGKYGHIERANAVTHLIACFLFLAFAFMRPWLLGAKTLSAQLSGIAILFTSATFAVSTVYHTYATVPFWGVGMRTLDHASIAISIAAANVADLCMVTRNFIAAPAQGWLDPIVAAGVLVLYFGARRWYVPREETKEMLYSGEGCSLGLFRTYHSDLEHAALRASSTATLTVAWVLAVPAAWNNLDGVAAAVWFTGAATGTLLLVGGVVLDNMNSLDNMFLRKGNANFGPCNCASKTMGCALNTHALWHVIAILGAVAAIAAREYGIASLSTL